MRYYLRIVLLTFVASIPTLVLTSVVGVLAWLQAVPWYQLALGVIFALAGSLFLINQFRGWWPTRRIKDDKWLSETISRWLLDAGLTLTNVPEKTMAFNYRVQDFAGRAFALFRLRDKGDDIHLQFNLIIPPEQQTAIGRLEENEQKKFVADVNVEMARLGVMYQVVGTPPTQINVETRVPLDMYFERFKIIQHALMMSRANILLSVHISRAVGEL